MANRRVYEAWHARQESLDLLARVMVALAEGRAAAERIRAAVAAIHEWNRQREGR